MTEQELLQTGEEFAEILNQSADKIATVTGIEGLTFTAEFLPEIKHKEGHPLLIRFSRDGKAQEDHECPVFFVENIASDAKLNNSVPGVLNAVLNMALQDYLHTSKAKELDEYIRNNGLPSVEKDPSIIDKIVFSSVPEERAVPKNLVFNEKMNAIFRFNDAIKHYESIKYPFPVIEGDDEVMLMPVLNEGITEEIWAKALFNARQQAQVTMKTSVIAIGKYPAVVTYQLHEAGGHYKYFYLYERDLLKDMVSSVGASASELLIGMLGESDCMAYAMPTQFGDEPIRQSLEAIVNLNRRVLNSPVPFYIWNLDEGTVVRV